jgi:hypothetical protein
MGCRTQFARPRRIDLNRFVANSMPKPRMRFALATEQDVCVKALHENVVHVDRIVNDHRRYATREHYERGTQRITIHTISVITLTPGRSPKRRPKK